MAIIPKNAAQYSAMPKSGIKGLSSECRSKSSGGWRAQYLKKNGIEVLSEFVKRMQESLDYLKL
jgi:hypothetical protein